MIHEATPGGAIVDHDHLRSTVAHMIEPPKDPGGYLDIQTESIILRVERGGWKSAEITECMALRREGAPAFVISASGVVRRLSSVQQELATSV